VARKEHGMSKSSRGNYFSNGGFWWKAETLWKAVEGAPVEDVSVESLLNDPEVRRALDGDLNYPIILGPDGTIYDGFHRLVKAWALGLPTIRVKRLPKMPPPDGEGD
jgi:hypothetical protein